MSQRTKTPISIRKFATHPNMLGLDLYPNQLKILESLYQKGTSRMVVAAGRRGGKSLISAVSTLYAAYIMQPIFAKALAPGEPFYCMVISATADQASRLLKRIRALIDNHSSMVQEIKSESATSIELYNGAIITSQTYSARGAVGNAVAHLVCDEMGRWMASGNHTNVDATEVLQAVTPSLAQFPESRQLFVSTPWLQSGEFHRLYKLSQSPDCPQGLVGWNFTSQQLNPTITDSWIQQERELMGDKYVRAEYYGEFQDAIDNWLDSFLIRQQVRHNNSHHKPNPDYYGQYILALDPASGKEGRDSFAACIGHVNQDSELIIDRFHTFSGGERGVDFEKVRDWALRMHEAYGFQLVTADQHQARMLLQQLQSSGIPTRENHWTVTNHMQAFNKLSQLFISERISLPNHHQAIDQLVGLRQSWRQNGSFKVSGGAGSSVDDLASALAGVALFAPTELSSGLQFTSKPVSGWAA